MYDFSDSRSNNSNLRRGGGGEERRGQNNDYQYTLLSAVLYASLGDGISLILD